MLFVTLQVQTWKVMWPLYFSQGLKSYVQFNLEKNIQLVLRALTSFVFITFPIKVEERKPRLLRQRKKPLGKNKGDSASTTCSNRRHTPNFILERCFHGLERTCKIAIIRIAKLEVYS